MKKTKVVGTLALASCVMLSGCNLFKKKVLSVADLPHLVAGEQFDLQSYVTAQGYKGSFSVVPSEESKGFLAVDESGTKITASHSGDIKFTVNYGKLSAEVAAVVDSKEYVEYAKVATDKQQNFELDIFGHDQETDKSYVDFVELYTKDYFLTVDYPESESAETSYVGTTEIGGKVISFSLAVDEEAGTIEVDDYFLQGDEPESLSSKCKVFPLVASKGKCKYVPAEGEYEAYEAISFTDEALVSEAAEYLFGIDEFMVSYFDMKLKEIEVVPEEVTYEGETWTEYGVVLMGDFTSEGEKYENTGIDYLYATIGDDAVWFEGLEDEFVESLPANGSATEADLEVLAGVIAGENYTMVTSSMWIDYNASAGTYTPVYTNPFLDSSIRSAAGLGNMGSVGNYTVDYFNAFGTVATFVTSTQTLTYHEICTGEDNEHNPIYKYDVKGLVENGGNVYSYVPHATEDKYSASLIAPESEIKDLETVAQSYQHLMNFGEVYYNSREESAGQVVLSFAYGAARNEMYNLYVSSVPELIQFKPYSGSMTPLQFVHQCDDLSNLIWLLSEDGDLDTVTASLSYSASSIGLSFVYNSELPVAIAPDPEQPEQVEYHIYLYQVSTSIMAIGGTDIDSVSAYFKSAGMLHFGGDSLAKEFSYIS